MLDVFSELYKETNATTINIRILGTDKVCNPSLVSPIRALNCAVLISDTPVYYHGLRTHKVYV